MARNTRRQFFTGRKSGQIAPKWPTSLKEEKNTRIGSKIFLLALTSTAWCHLFLFSPAFQIVQIRAEGPDLEIADEIKQAAIQQKQRGNWFFPQNNIFLFRLGHKEQLLPMFGVSQLKVHKNYVDRTVTYYFTPQEPRLIFVTNNQALYLDVTGEVIESKRRSATNIFQPGLPILFLQTPMSKDFKPNYQLIETVRRVQIKLEQLGLAPVAYKIDNTPTLPIKSSKQLTSQELATDATTEITKNSLPELQAVVKEAWVIHFGDKLLKNSENLKSALSNLEIFVKNKYQTGKIRDLKYVDLRFGDRIYYK